MTEHDNTPPASPPEEVKPHLAAGRPPRVRRIVELGSAMVQPNKAGGGAHVANASFMVAPHAGGRGVGRALGQHILELAMPMATMPCSSTPWSRPTPPLCGSGSPSASAY